MGDRQSAMGKPEVRMCFFGEKSVCGIVAGEKNLFVNVQKRANA
jgi:hypothetical protein